MVHIKLGNGIVDFQETQGTNAKDFISHQKGIQKLYFEKPKTQGLPMVESLTG